MVLRRETANNFWARENENDVCDTLGQEGIQNLCSNLQYKRDWKLPLLTKWCFLLCVSLGPFRTKHLNHILCTASRSICSLLSSYNQVLQMPCSFLSVGCKCVHYDVVDFAVIAIHHHAFVLLHLLYYTPRIQGLSFPTWTFCHRNALQCDSGRGLG